MHYFVTGATGELGKLVVASLSSRVGADRIVAIVRDRAKAQVVLPRDVQLRVADYDRPETLEAAIAGAPRLLLISSNAIGSRIAHHVNVVEAARRSQVGRIAYTSFLRADAHEIGAAKEHHASELAIEASGIPCTFLRNGWYSENYCAGVPAAVKTGNITGCAGAGRISSASRADFAEAAAIALINDEGPRVVHELAGDEAYTLAEFAGLVSRRSGKHVVYRDISEGAYREELLAMGLPLPLADLYANSDASARQGALFDDSRTLSRLIGRPTTHIDQTIYLYLHR